MIFMSIIAVEEKIIENTKTVKNCEYLATNFL